jgi:hypothetical protein
VLGNHRTRHVLHRRERHTILLHIRPGAANVLPAPVMSAVWVAEAKSMLARLANANPPAHIIRPTQSRVCDL